MLRFVFHSTGGTHWRSFRIRNGSNRRVANGRSEKLCNVHSSRNIITGKYAKHKVVGSDMPQRCSPCSVTCRLTWRNEIIRYIRNGWAKVIVLYCKISTQACLSNASVSWIQCKTCKSTLQAHYSGGDGGGGGDGRGSGGGGGCGGDGYLESSLPHLISYILRESSVRINRTRRGRRNK